MIDAARYIVALLWTALCPLILFWIPIHPLAAFWRRIGMKTAYVTVGLPIVCVTVLVVVFRESILVTAFGSSPLLWVLAAAVYGLAIGIELQCRKHLKLRIIIGIQELQADQSRRKLLTEGIYGRIRHPRYVSLFLISVAVALFANYLVTWILLPLIGAALAGVALLEERELRKAFGEEYERYCARVPRFIPGRSGS